LDEIGKFGIAGHVIRFDFMGHEWTVKCESFVIHECSTKMGKMNCAQCEIFVSLEYPETMQRSTLLHELIHMIDFIGGCNIDEDTTGILETLLFDLILKGGFPYIKTLEEWSEAANLKFEVKRFHYFLERLDEETTILEVVRGR
jgi:hypothetical protein